MPKKWISYAKLKQLPRIHKELLEDPENGRFALLCEGTMYCFSDYCFEYLITAHLYLK